MENSTKKPLIKPWIKDNLIENDYNYLALLFGLLLVTALLVFSKNEISDTIELRGYLISASSIYASILFTYLLQKASKINLEKEVLLKSPEIKEKFRALLYYRFLCFQIHEYFKTHKWTTFQKIKSLRITALELNMIDNSMSEYVDSDKLTEFEQYQKEEVFAVDYAIIIKFSDQLSQSVITQINLIDTVFYSNNESINKYINLLITEGPFNRVQNLETSPLNEFSKYLEERVSNSNHYKFFEKDTEFNKRNPLINLVSIERHILNNVLFELYKVTFIIEKSLSNSFICLFVNLAIILTFGTILPLVNAFINSNLLNNLSLIVTVVAICLSLIYLGKIFLDNNDADLHKFSNVKYEGKN